ncbi:MULTISPECIES: polysaccharide deacetylase family protein [unclassified Bacillus (in: firmicutes)]|uniref:polysaccharide deacetylase family protein n=1 Tax=unclassified Bacillus (in: firmicutes) TaxID=185979 RepID=UPI0008E488CC|nr:MULTISPECIES: polysaccharide deacetylase family protein [unclassified Bacillus (in: firmicutes)]SFA70147.1 Peptidoglycan/xylan/chitin deacetylase, PgdA/CDA1 family [Bacillus sp. UNCCL13]SFQ59692.1 Peptidoglycan/xylan/chitin deacetylase, PgdA/CDA1 family [Bacillus sp. cl95]
MGKLRIKDWKNLKKVCMITILVILPFMLLLNSFLAQAETRRGIVIQKQITHIAQHEERMTLERQKQAAQWAHDEGHKTIDTPQNPPAEQPVTEEKPTIPANQTPPKTTIYLTFDDGPFRFSGELLSLLEKYDVKATFFMLDGNMLKYPDIVKEMVNKGHSVGMHGVTHDKHKFYASTSSVIGEMKTAQKTIEVLTGVESNLIRTPYGSKPGMTIEYRQAVINEGFEMWDWNIDSRDWYFKDQRYVASVIAQLEKLKGSKESIVILLHERKETLTWLPMLLDYLLKNQYDCQPISETMEPVAFK